MPEFNQGYEAKSIESEFMRKVKEMLSQRIDVNEEDLSNAFKEASA